MSIILVLYPSSKWIALELEFVSSRAYDNHQVGDASADETFGTIDISPTHDPELSAPKIHPLYPCRNSATSVAKSSRPRKTRSNNFAKQQVALISSEKSLDHSPVGRSLVLYVPPPTAPAEGPKCLVQPTSTIKLPAPVEPNPPTKATEDMKQATCIDFRALQWFWDSDKCEPSLPLTRTPSLYDRSSSQVLPPRSRSKPRLLFVYHRRRPCWPFGAAQQVVQPGKCQHQERSGFKSRQ